MLQINSQRKNISLFPTTHAMQALHDLQPRLDAMQAALDATELVLKTISSATAKVPVCPYRWTPAFCFSEVYSHLRSESVSVLHACKVSVLVYL